MKIFIVTRGYPTDSNPVLGIFEFGQAKALQQRGFNIVYLALDFRSIRRKRKFGYSSFKKEGVQVEEMSIPLGAIPRNLLLKIGKYGFNSLMKKVVKKYGKPDIIHAHFLDIASTVYDCDMYGAKFVITEHSSQLNGEIDKKNAAEIKEVYKKADALISVSDNLKKRIYELTGLESICINNMLDTSRFTYADKEQKEYFAFMTTSALKEHKRIDLIIDAFYELKTKHEIKNIKFNIVGDGPQKTYLEDKVRKLGLENQVFFYGMQSQSSINEILHESDCFVLASKKETFGVACAEAIASGTPVLITRCGGPEEFVCEENGFVTDDDKLAFSMKHMIDICKNFDMKKASYDIKNKFDEELISSKLESVYRETQCLI